MTAVLKTRALGKRYRQRQALTGCTLSIPAGHVVGLVGPNGAGKTTLLNLAAGMLGPTSGTIEVLGGKPGSGPAGGVPIRLSGPHRATAVRPMPAIAMPASRTAPGPEPTARRISCMHGT